MVTDLPLKCSLCSVLLTNHGRRQLSPKPWTLLQRNVNFLPTYLASATPCFWLGYPGTGTLNPYRSKTLSSDRPREATQVYPWTVSAPLLTFPQHQFGASTELSDGETVTEEPSTCPCWAHRLVWEGGHKRSKQESNMILSGDKRYERNKCRAWQRRTEPGTMSIHLKMVREDLPEKVRSHIRSKGVTKPAIYKI